MKIKIGRKIDKLGRLVLPIDLRKQYAFKPGETVWIEAYDKGVLIYSEEFKDDYKGEK